MLVFFIHGVNTKKSSYANTLIENIKREVNLRKTNPEINFYSSFWGNLFNNKKHQIIGCIQKDFARVREKHSEYKSMHRDIYRYQNQRNQVINNFLGDFLIYQNPERGKAIRKAVFDQFIQYLDDHPQQKQVHFVAHSLGSFILWDLLFSSSLTHGDPAFSFREKMIQLDLTSITTMGSPLLFLKQMLDLDFSKINDSLAKKSRKTDVDSYKLRWVNIIHSSDLVAYPLQAAVEDEIGSDILFCDQYVWLDANLAEATLHIVTAGQSDLAMVAAAEDAHSSYFQNNKDGAITGRIVAYNLLGDTERLLKRCVTPR